MPPPFQVSHSNRRLHVANNAQDQRLGADGLRGILRGFGSPTSSHPMQAVEEQRLRFSNGLRLDDDVTFLEVRIN